MNSFEIGVLSLIVYFCVYGLINRICQCVEYCAECECMICDIEYEEEQND